MAGAAVDEKGGEGLRGVDYDVLYRESSDLGRRLQTSVVKCSKTAAGKLYGSTTLSAARSALCVKGPNGAPVPVSELLKKVAEHKRHKWTRETNYIRAHDFLHVSTLGVCRADNN